MELWTCFHVIRGKTHIKAISDLKWMPEEKKVNVLE